MNDEEFRRQYEEEKLDTYADSKKVLDEEFEFLSKNWFNYIIVFVVSLIIIAVIIAAFLNIVSWLIRI